MLKRFRQLRISLAAKFQILYGIAVAMIIGMALLVPWWRMEELTDQINQRSAQTLADEALATHVRGKTTFSPAAPTTERSTPATATSPATPPTTSPSTAPTTAPTTAPSPRSGAILLRIDAPRSSLTRFEQQSIVGFIKDPELAPQMQNYTKAGIARYRYATRLNADASCLKCHTLPDPTAATRPAVAGSLIEPSPAGRLLIGIVSVDIPSQIDAGQIFLNRLFIFTAGLIAGLLAVLVFYVITTRLILEPVRVLRETAEKVSQGDLNIRSDINTGDEFQQLSETFNTMLINLKRNADQLRSVNKSLDLKLGELAASNVALFESNRLKSEFLANVSHELRTPLNSILGFADLLKDANSAEPKSTRWIQNILTSGRNLLDLINDLLDLAKIEAGRMEVRSEPLSLGDLFEGLINVLKPLCERREIVVISSVAGDVPILHTDPAKLQQILYNFLSNAIKFSPAGAHIDIAADRPDVDHIRISVTDHGPGIAAPQHQIIFEKFRQADGSVTREHQGSGLGLAIAKELTQLLGGSIGVISQPGEGATFWVTLPLKIEGGPRDLRGQFVIN
jgi:signal transduction histidine kinase